MAYTRNEVIEYVSGFYTDWLEKLGLPEKYIFLVRDYTMFLALMLVSGIAYFITKIVVLRVIRNLARRSKTNWDDALLEMGFFNRLSHIVPAYMVYAFTPLVLTNYPQSASVIQTILIIIMVLIFLGSINAFLNALNIIFQEFTIARSKPVKGYVQAAKILVFSIGTIVVIAHLFGKNPLGLLGGLGAFTAVLMLIFKDPILGLVGGVQLSANELLKVGDWVSVPEHNADGTVVDISLTTVKIQNWDKSISTVPTYYLISESFQNWRGMEESGARRIKTSFLLDAGSIRVCPAGWIEVLGENLQMVGFTSEFLDKNGGQPGPTGSSTDPAGATNLGLFRLWLTGYMKKHPDIHHDMSVVVRYLPARGYGLPVEIQAYCRETEWNKYEDVLAGILEHILAALPSFELRLFQERMTGKYSDG
jgi:miniconductance mechanosensitive channel